LGQKHVRALVCTPAPLADAALMAGSFITWQLAKLGKKINDKAWNKKIASHHDQRSIIKKAAQALSAKTPVAS